MGTCIPEHSTSCLAVKKRFRHVCMQGFIQDFMLGGDGGTLVWDSKLVCETDVQITSFWGGGGGDLGPPEFF